MCVVWRKHRCHIYDKLLSAKLFQLLKLDFYHTKAEMILQPLYLPFLSGYFLFFLLVTNFSEGWTPP